MTQAIETTITGHGTSRIGWGAVFAGFFVAFSIIVILNALGVAVGLSGGGTVGIGTGIWAAIVSFFALFAGGWFMTRSEFIGSRKDAAMHGVVLWGMLFLALSFLALSGMQLGLNLVTGALSSVTQEFSMAEITDFAARMGLTPEQIVELQGRFQESALTSAKGAWWSFIALGVSLLAVVLGAVTGVPGGRRRRRPAAQTIDQEVVADERFTA